MRYVHVPSLWKNTLYWLNGCRVGGGLDKILGNKPIMAYGSTPYVGMAPKKNGGHIKSAQMTCLKCLR